MRIFSFIYRFMSNFVFLSMVYLSLNYIDQYSHRAVFAMVVLSYTAMRSVSALRTFYFFSRIELLEIEARRLMASVVNATAAAARKPIVGQVSLLRHDGEIKSYIDLFFLASVVLLCVAKIVTD
ncbi:hypothetical protein [Bradyrhizobium sp.]|uniref:hypothetical protein n=1 Tax=Bradyrhizobium sp. TaxID=376 RepID=UPI003C4AECE3